MKASIVPTSDGSNTLRHPILQELYHSVHGAITESQHVFIRAGLIPMLRDRKHLHILEVGFGTGLNALLTLKHTQSLTDIQIHYTSIEPYPIDLETVNQLGYCEALEAPELQDFFVKMHACAQDVDTEITPSLTLLKRKTTLEEIDFGEARFDLVYFDAFAPATQPQLWEEACLSKIRSALNPQAVLVTYCAKGVFKRTLKALGLEVEGIPGPPRKREMTRATWQGEETV